MTRAAAITVGAIVAVALPLKAQETGVIRGQVTTVGTGSPVEGAQVFLAGPDVGTLTDAEGNFELRDAPAGQLRVRVQRIGYASASRSVTVQAGQSVTVNFQLRSSAVAMEGIVVTGTAGEQQKRELGNVVSQISVSEPVEKGGVVQVSQLVKARVPNVTVRTSSGQAGAGADIKIRGTGSFSLGGNPLIYVDGVRVDNTFDKGLDVQGFGAGLEGGLDDLDPSQFESVEIIKGAAAATLYGSEASSGVVQITTKQGRPGDVEWSLRMNQGANWFRDAAQRIPENWGTNPETGEPYSLNLVEREQERGTPIFRTGHNQQYGGSVRGGTQDFTYYVGGNVALQEGVEKTNRMRRVSGQANFTAYATENLQIDANFGLVQTFRRFEATGGNGGTLFSLIFSDPESIDTNRRGFLFAPPEVQRAIESFPSATDKVTYGSTARWTPADWFRTSLTVGQDNSLTKSEEVTERQTDPAITEFLSPTAATGSKTRQVRDKLVTTVDWNSSLTFGLTEKIDSEFSFGAQYISRFTDFTTVEGQGFPAPGVDVLSAAAQINSAGDANLEDNTLGGFVQDRLSLVDRLFLTAGVRVDDNSSLGEETEAQIYPKVNASWVISEESFFDLGFVDELRLRAAFGQAGQVPAVFSALRTYQPITSGSGATALTPQEIGNPNLKPERETEIEGGLEASLLEERLSLSATYYWDRTTDAILQKDVSPSLGFPGGRFVNAGEISTTGIEAQISGQPIRTDPVALDLNLQLGTTNNEVVALGEAARGAGFLSRGLIRHVPGLPVAAWFEQKVVDAELNDQGRAVNVMCDGGDPNGRTLPDGTPVETGGDPVPCSEAPELFLGQSTPTFTGSMTANLTFFNHLTLYALFDWSTGSKKWDNNLRARCQIFNTCRANFFPSEEDPALVAQYQSPGDLRSFSINEDDFGRLREISVTGRFPDSWVNALNIGAERVEMTVIGRNLVAPITNWTGLDPETEFGSDRNFAFIEQNTLPPTASITGAVRLAF